MQQILIYCLLAVHIIISLLLLLIIMMQRPRSEGLGTAFGGGVTDTLFGSSAGNTLTKITSYLGAIFFITTIALAYLYSHPNSSGTLGEKLEAVAPIQKPIIPTNAPNFKPIVLPPTSNSATNHTTEKPAETTAVSTNKPAPISAKQQIPIKNVPANKTEKK